MSLWFDNMIKNCLVKNVDTDTFLFLTVTATATEIYFPKQFQNTLFKLFIFLTQVLYFRRKYLLSFSD